MEQFIRLLDKIKRLESYDQKVPEKARKLIDSVIAQLDDALKLDCLN